MTGAFTRRKVDGMAPWIREIATDLFRAAAETGTLEVVDDLAYPLPLRVICELLGVPYEDRRLLQDWSSELATVLDPPLGTIGQMTREAARPAPDSSTTSGV